MGIIRAAIGASRVTLLTVARGCRAGRDGRQHRFHARRESAQKRQTQPKCQGDGKHVSKTGL
jgi:hypothetical protein